MEHGPADKSAAAHFGSVAPEVPIAYFVEFNAELSNNLIVKVTMVAVASEPLTPTKA